MRAHEFAVEDEDRPGGADSWASYALGDGPADTNVDIGGIGGIEAGTGCGDPGCFISARWVTPGSKSR